MRSDVVKFKTLDGATTYNSVTDWGMTLTHCDEQKPAPKFERIDVPGTNGSVDVSAALSGDIPFEDRTVELTFFKLCADHDAAFTLAGDVADAVHGKQMQLQTPDARTDGDTWYTGDVEITECRFEDRGCEIDVRAVCSPFRLSETDGYVEAPVGSVTTVDEAAILKVPENCRQLARDVYARIVGDTSITQHIYRSRGIAMCFAKTSNLFDLDTVTLRGVLVPANSKSWKGSTSIHQNDQQIAFGTVSTGRVYRAVVTSTPATTLPYSPDFIFPFAENTRARVWAFCDKVTAVEQRVDAGGSYFEPGVIVDGVERASSSIRADGLFSSGVYFTMGTIAAPAVGSSWNGDYLDFAVRPHTTQISFSVAGMTADNVYLLMAFYKADETAPASWIDPDVTVSTLQLPQPFKITVSGGEWVSDMFDNSIADAFATFYNDDGTTDYVTLQKIPDVPDAQYIQVCQANASGDLTRGLRPVFSRLQAFEMQELVFDAGAQPAYPTVTTSPRAGAVVEYNDNTYLLSINSTVKLDTLLNRGNNTVSVSTIPSVSSLSISWPKGVL